MKKILLSAILYMLLAFPLCAQENALTRSRSSNETTKETIVSIPDDIQKKLSKFFETLVTKQTETAFTELLTNSPVNQRQDQVQKLIFETKRANKLYGDIKGYEVINSEMVSPALIRIRYLGYYELFPMRWIFTFYKSPNQNWIITNIKFDDLSENFFKEE